MRYGVQSYNYHRYFEYIMKEICVESIYVKDTLREADIISGC